MNAKDLTYFLENPARLGSRETVQLESILQEYPYFQAVRAVYLKGLYTEGSFKYNTELKKTAAYTTDRSVLFDFITSPAFNQDKIALQIKKQEELLRNITVFEAEEVFGSRSIAIDEAIKMKKNESERVMDPDLFERRAEKPSKEIEKFSEEVEKPSAEVERSSEEVEKASEEKKGKEEVEEKKPAAQAGESPQPGSPLEFDATEAHSFSEWLRLTRAQPIERDNEEANKLRERKFELIDDFISKSPKIKPSKPASSTNLAQDRAVPPEALMTETLARVYMEQKNYKKAIQAYKILILKNPEKSGFFADQIRAIKKLQENNTGKE